MYKLTRCRTSHRTATSATATTRPLRRAALTQALRRLLRTSPAVSTAARRATARPRANMDLARVSTVVLRVATASRNKVLVVSTVATSTAVASMATVSTVALGPSNTRSPASTAHRLVTVDSHSTATASRALAVMGLKVRFAAAFCSSLLVSLVHEY
jgi:hypothetical protein